MTGPRLLSRCLVTFSVVPLVAAVTAAAPSTPAVGAITGLGTAACDPVQTPATVRADVPTAQRVLGFPLGRRDVTAAESDTYLGAVDRASPRVTSGTLATSVRGRPLRYAVVGQPENVTPAGLARVRRNTAALRDPRTPARQVKRLAASTPAILWVTGNVHGDEKSGTDGALRTLYELAARTDCAARRILDNAVVVLLPMQNPDGRQAGTRQNASGFDMNRDWFARTQPETDGKVELMRKLPPVLFIDAHEMGGKSYFFPPNADPIYHEISGESVDWINNLFGKSMATEFTRQKLPFFNRDVYDLFYLGYGDTVPATGWNAAGMTFEKGGDDSTPRRVYQQYLTQWVSLSAAAGQRRQVLTGWHTAYQDAYQQGRAGRLEPNEIVNPGNDLVTQVPDRRVRHYFLRDEPAKRVEVRELVRRLQRMDVAVYRLRKPLRVPDYRPYARAERSAVLPAGTYWIPMAQAQKHWIQALLNEDTYTPFPYFYDVTGWSNPLLFNVSGGSSGRQLSPDAARTPVLAAPPAPAPASATPGRVTAPPVVGVFQLSTDPSAAESTGWLRHLLAKVWRLPHREVTAADVRAGRLAEVDVLLAPDGTARDASTALGRAGRERLVAWARAGGHYVGWRGGTELAASLGITTATLTDPTADIPGTLLRATVDRDSPLAAGASDPSSGPSRPASR